MNKQAIVVKSNALIESSYCLDVAEQRVILGCIAKITPKTEPTGDDLKLSLSAKELKSLLPEMSRQQIYDTLKAGVSKLADRKYTYKGNDPDQDDWWRWVQAARYESKTATAHIHFTEYMIPHLYNLKERFTVHQIGHVIQMRSSYAYRIYELLLSYKRYGEWVFTVEQLRECLDIGDKYDRITNLKQRVIKPAIREINQHSDMYITELQEILDPKDKRKVISIRFKFKLTGSTGEQKTKIMQNEREARQIAEHQERKAQAEAETTVSPEELIQAAAINQARRQPLTPEQLEIERQRQLAAIEAKLNQDQMRT